MKTFQVVSGNTFLEIKADSFSSNGENGLVLYKELDKGNSKIIAMFNHYSYIMEISEKNET